jgi:hypothetical protein
MWIFVDVSRSIFFSGGEDATLLAVQKLGQLSDEEEILWGLASFLFSSLQFYGLSPQT